MCTSAMTERKMIDIHMHLIPGVDDGAEDMMMSRVMLIRALEEGVRTVFCTPHSECFEYDEEGGRILFDRLKNNVGRIYPDVRLYLGCEVFCEAGMMKHVLEKLNTGWYPTMNASRYVLMEFSPYTEEKDAAACVSAMLGAGYKPIIAHMERYRCLQGNMELVDQFRKDGVRIQINAYSLSDKEENEAIRNWARRLVLERKADFLGTDGHKSYHRPPSAAMGLDWLYGNVDETYADAVAWGNAETYLCG